MLCRTIIMIVLLFIGTQLNAQEIQLTFERASTTPLSNPHDLKLTPDGKYLFVSDVGNNRIAILDPQTLELLTSFGTQHQSGTHDVDFDGAGQVYVADTHNNRVLIYALQGPDAKLVGQLDERIRGPEGVLVHANGRVYVAGAWSGNVVAFENGKVVNELDGLSSPHDLVQTGTGDILLADSGNHRILQLSPKLEIKRELSQEQYDFNGVRYMDLTADGTLIAADKYNHQIKFIGTDDRLLKVLGSGKPQLGINKFTTPEGVEVHGQSLWLSDSGNNRLVKYRIH